MRRRGALTTEVKKAIRNRAALLSCVVWEAETRGASPEVIERHFNEELETMRATLSEFYPPERVKAIVDELLDAYHTYRGSA